jgi:hypothetical protein
MGGHDGQLYGPGDWTPGPLASMNAGHMAQREWNSNGDNWAPDPRATLGIFNNTQPPNHTHMHSNPQGPRPEYAADPRDPQLEMPAGLPRVVTAPGTLQPYFGNHDNIPWARSPSLPPRPVTATIPGLPPRPMMAASPNQAPRPAVPITPSQPPRLAVPAGATPPVVSPRASHTHQLRLQTPDVAQQTFRRTHARPKDEDGAPRPRPPKQRVGGPPKAVLGGAGGKTWDERMQVDSSTSSSSPARSASSPVKGGTTNGTDPNQGQDGPTYKGSPIIFRAPPSTYSPPDSPEPLKVPSEYTTYSDSPISETNPSRRSRKQAFPWPGTEPRGPPEEVPLPISPITSPIEKGGQRTWTSISSTASTGALSMSRGIRKAKGKGKGKAADKEVVVSLPTEVCLVKRQRDSVLMVDCLG